MSKNSGFIDISRTVLLVVMFFFIFLFLLPFDIVFVPALFYAFWYYYKKSKRLQMQLNESARVKPGATSASLSPDSLPPPPSTDA